MIFFYVYNRRRQLVLRTTDPDLAARHKPGGGWIVPIVRQQTFAERAVAA